MVLHERMYTELFVYMLLIYSSHRISLCHDIAFACWFSDDFDNPLIECQLCTDYILSEHATPQPAQKQAALEHDVISIKIRWDVIHRTFSMHCEAKGPILCFLVINRWAA